MIYLVADEFIVRASCEKEAKELIQHELGCSNPIVREIKPNGPAIFIDNSGWEMGIEPEALEMIISEDSEEIINHFLTED